jgi:hypothetical protein
MRRGSSSRLRRRALAAEAVTCLALARVAVVLLPFHVLSRWLGVRRGETPGDVVADARTRGVGKAVAAAAQRTPWRSKCLEQAIAAKAMLRRRGVESTLYLGVVREPMAAHAWLRVGEHNVTGGQEVSQYAVVASFAEIERR